ARALLGRRRTRPPRRRAAAACGRGGAGFDMLDVGAVAARSGPPVPAEAEASALVPAVEGLAPSGLPISADTFSVEVARLAIEAGGGPRRRHPGGAHPAVPGGAPRRAR